MRNTDKITESLENNERLSFVKVLRCYESKDFKKGLKLCNSILSTNQGTNHPETLSLKGLFLFCMGQLDEGYKICKEGLQKNLESYMCWHILGLIDRDSRKFKSAYGCFKNAVSFNPTNLQILKDFASIQLQQGDFNGHMNTREKIYTLEPNTVMNIIAYAYSCYLCKEYKKGIDIIHSTQKEYSTFYEQLSFKELNDLILFELEMIVELKDFDLMNKFIIKHNNNIFDKETLTILKATAYEYQEKYDLAAEKYLQLILFMPDNISYIDKYAENFKKIHKNLINESENNQSNDLLNENQNYNIESEENKIQRIIYKCLIENIPDSLILKQRYHQFCNLKDFELDIEDYLKMSISKKIPHGISHFKKLYENDILGKVEIVEEKLFKLININNSNPELLKWCYYYMAIHYKLIDNFTDSIYYLDKAINIDKNMFDSLVLMAKIYQKVENFECAHSIIKYVADCVPNDRYINSIAGKCFFYINEMDLAERYMQKFSKFDQTIDSYMRDVQNLWFRVHKATLFYRQKNYFESLYQIKLAECHFEQFSFDRIDFHNYCLRRLLIKPHENMLLQEKSLKSSKFYYLLIKVTAKTLVDIMYLLTNNNVNQSNQTILSSKQKKQERLKKLKEMKKESKKNGDTPIIIQSNNKIKSCCIKKHSLETSDKLKILYMDNNYRSKFEEELLNVADTLKIYFNHKFKVQTLLFEIYLILGKNEQLLECYNQMININSKHYKLFYFEDRLLKYFVNNVSKLSDEFKSLILTKFPLTELDNVKYDTYVSFKLANLLKNYNDTPWNLVTYIIVATQHNIESFIYPTTQTLFNFFINEKDYLSYTELVKFRKFVRRFIPNHLQTLDSIISDSFPVIFKTKDSINYF